MSHGNKNLPHDTFQSNRVGIPSGEEILTENGYKKVEEITLTDTLEGHKIINIFKHTYEDVSLILFPINSIYENIPCKDTCVSIDNNIIYKRKKWKASELVKKKKIIKIEKENICLYNFLLEKEDNIEVNGILVHCEGAEKQIKKTKSKAASESKTAQNVDDQLSSINKLIHKDNEMKAVNAENDVNITNGSKRVPQGLNSLNFQWQSKEHDMKIVKEPKQDIQPISRSNNVVNRHGENLDQEVSKKTLNSLNFQWQSTENNKQLLKDSTQNISKKMNNKINEMGRGPVIKQIPIVKELNKSQSKTKPFVIKNNHNKKSIGLNTMNINHQ